MTYIPERLVFIWSFLHGTFPDHTRVDQVLVDTFGQPEFGTRFHRETMMSLQGNDVGIVYVLKLTPDELLTIKQNLAHANFSFDELFEREWGHVDFFISLDDDDEEENPIIHQGIAYEQEDHWNMYYFGGPLTEHVMQKYPLTEDGRRIGSVLHTEIDTPSDLDHFFRAWLVKESGALS